MQTSSVISSSRQALLAISGIADRIRVTDGDVSRAETAFADIDSMLSMAIASSSDEVTVLRMHRTQAKRLLHDIRVSRVHS